MVSSPRFMKPARLFLTLGTLLLSSLACRAARELVFPEAPVTIAPLTDSPPAPVAPTETDLPQLTCPDVTGKVLVAATEYMPDEPEELGPRDPEVTYLLTYGVSGDELELLYIDPVGEKLLPFQQDESTQLQAWEFFTRLIPPEGRGVLSEYSIMTDGKGNLLAAVAQTGSDPERWALEVDILDTEDRLNLTYTLVHEFAHLLTLNPSQVTPSLPVFENPENDDIYLSEVSVCPDYFPGEGCALPGSYINQFFNRFWSDLHTEWQDVNLIEDDEAYYAALDDFYYAHEDRFLTDYAATNPEEDIAEAFSFFVLAPRPEGASIAEEKMLFFYDYPELVSMRDQILNAICVLNP